MYKKIFFKDIVIYLINFFVIDNIMVLINYFSIWIMVFVFNNMSNIDWKKEIFVFC